MTGNILNTIRSLVVISSVILVLSTTTKSEEKEVKLNLTVDTSNTTHRFTVEIVRGTPYNPTISQCDSTPFGTADGSRIDTNIINQLRWCAVSQELLKQFGGKFWYGDTIYVYPLNYRDSKYEKRIIGRWIIHDTMNKKMRKSMDFLCSSGHIRGVFKDLIIVKINR